jgi:DNA-binding transcriptional regulator YdaS (Cro superfamily)
LSKPEIDDGLRRAIAKAGSANALANALGMSAAALSEWRRVPAHRILQVEAVTGIPREKLWPELDRPLPDWIKK